MPLFSPSRAAGRPPNVLYAIILAGYLALTFVVLEQAHTIDSQRALIRNLFEDSRMLATLQMQRLHAQGAPTAPAPPAKK